MRESLVFSYGILKAGVRIVFGVAFGGPPCCNRKGPGAQQVAQKVGAKRCLVCFSLVIVVCDRFVNLLSDICVFVYIVVVLVGACVASPTAEQRRSEHVPYAKSLVFSHVFLEVCANRFRCGLRWFPLMTVVFFMGFEGTHVAVGEVQGPKS